jgi:hypothetical protein
MCESSEVSTTNPRLATLMRVIEDNQEKITEGEYLEAMNALGSLHREILRPATAATVAPSSDNLFTNPLLRTFPPGMAGNLTEIRAWERVSLAHPIPLFQRISPEEWIALPYETRFGILREVTEHSISVREEIQNPDPSVCPFIARHAIGYWGLRDDNRECWECVCGYFGKTKNWKKHESSKRHQEWAKHRTVSRRRIQKMKDRIKYDDAGSFSPYVRVSIGQPDLYPGGIMLYLVSQERNEWTNPELFSEVHRSPIPTDDGRGQTWFVHPRNTRAREYVN